MEALIPYSQVLENIVYFLDDKGKQYFLIVDNFIHYFYNIW